MSITTVSLAVVFLCMNIVTFALFGWDKASARRGRWRVSEGRLLRVSASGGVIGAKIAQRFFRHKTYKQPFAWNLNMIAVMQALLFILLAVDPLHSALGHLLGALIGSIPPVRPVS